MEKESPVFDEFGRVICGDCYGVMLVSSVRPGAVIFRCTDGTCERYSAYDRYNWKAPVRSDRRREKAVA